MKKSRTKIFHFLRSFSDQQLPATSIRPILFFVIITYNGNGNCFLVLMNICVNLNKPKHTTDIYLFPLLTYLYQWTHTFLLLISCRLPQTICRFLWRVHVQLQDWIVGTNGGGIHDGATVDKVLNGCWSVNRPMLVMFTVNEPPELTGPLEYLPPLVKWTTE